MLENTGSKYWFFLQDVWNKGKVFVKSRKKNSLLFSFYLILHGKCYQYFFASVLGSRLLLSQVICYSKKPFLKDSSYVHFKARNMCEPCRIIVHSLSRIVALISARGSMSTIAHVLMRAMHGAGQNGQCVGPCRYSCQPKQGFEDCA